MLYVIWILLMIYWGFRIIFSTGKFIIGLFIDKSSENNSYHSMNSVTLPPAIDTRTEDEIERDWEALLDLSKIIEYIYSLIMGECTIDKCLNCGNKSYIIIDISQNKIWLDCVSCLEQIVIENPMKNKKLLNMFRTFINYEPLYYYNMSDVLDRYNEIEPKKVSGRSKLIEKLNMIKNKTIRQYDREDSLTLTQFAVLIHANNI